MSHTPGPWTWEIRDGCIVAGDCHVVCFGHDYDDYGWIHGDDEKQIAANAQLIAAAPELLAALKALVPLATYAPDELGTSEAADDAERAIEIARAVIAKAEARS